MARLESASMGSLINRLVGRLLGKGRVAAQAQRAGEAGTQQGASPSGPQEPMLDAAQIPQRLAEALAAHRAGRLEQARSQ